MPQPAWVTAKNKKQKWVYLHKMYTKECKSKINQKINPTKEPQLSSSLLGRGNLPQRERSCRTWGVFMGRLHRADDPPFSTCKSKKKKKRQGRLRPFSNRTLPTCMSSCWGLTVWSHTRSKMKHTDKPQDGLPSLRQGQELLCLSVAVVSYFIFFGL